MSSPARTTTAYKTLLARAIMGETVNLKPATLVLGDGAFDSGTNTVRPPGESMYNALTPTYPLSPTRDGAQVRANVTVAGGNTPIAFSEIGVLSSDGVLILHRTLPPQTVTSGITVEFPLTILPPEGI